mgnify:CR=1 FL=1
MINLFDNKVSKTSKSSKSSNTSNISKTSKSSKYCQNYYVDITNTNNCTSARQPIFVNVNPLPTASIFTSGPSLVCLGQSSQLAIEFTSGTPPFFIGISEVESICSYAE